ncbi:MAG TPA: DUF4386 domain-containing protein, partial [Candidatus Limnocylindrales bacterium]
MQSYSAAQLEGLSYLSIRVFQTGFVTAQLFFGTWLFPLGCLVYRSRALPRVLSVLLVLDGVGVLVWFLQAMLLPDQPALAYPGLAVSFVAEGRARAVAPRPGREHRVPRGLAGGSRWLKARSARRGARSSARPCARAG